MKKSLVSFTLLISVFALLLSSCAPGVAGVTVARQPEAPAPQTVAGAAKAADPTATNTAAAPTKTPKKSNRSKTATATAAAAASNPTTQNTATTAVSTPSATPSAAQPSKGSSAQAGVVPAFDHIVLILLENRDYEEVINNPQMPHLNALAKQYALLARYHAIRHPSLPNYIALFSGSTQGITKDCTDCFVNQPNLADRIEASGRTWKTYEEDMPSPCFIGDAKPYMQKHNPLLYFDSVRLNTERCQRSIVPLTQLDADLATNQLPNFAFIMPNMCNSGHDCEPTVTDNWLNGMVNKLQNSPALGQNSLIIVTFDEASAQSTESCCGLSSKAGGRIAAVLISPLVKPGFTDGRESSHYDMLKTILTAWNLPDLGETAKDTVQPIVGPWQGSEK